jgi:hypothetical protein
MFPQPFRFRRLIIPILGLLVFGVACSVANADVPPIPREPDRSMMLPSPAQMAMAGLFLSAAILVVTSMIASQRGTPGNRPWALWNLIGIVISLGVTALLVLSSLGERAAYESRMAAHREEVKRIRRNYRSPSRDHGGPVMQEKRQNPGK